MSSFTKYTNDDAPEASARSLEGAKGAFGFVPHLLVYMAESPALLKSYMAVFGFLGESKLSPTEQQAVLMTVSRFHECRYCMTGHTKMSEMQGLDMGVVNAIRDDTPIGDPKLERFPIAWNRTGLSNREHRLQCRGRAKRESAKHSGCARALGGGVGRFRENEKRSRSGRCG